MSIIEAGQIYLHRDGGLYEVNAVVNSTDQYEVTGQLGGRRVLYTQLTQGHHPPGTPWDKAEEEFAGHSERDGQHIPNFELVAIAVEPHLLGHVGETILI